ncbi:uncharacterized protein LOC117171088 [Belonocnema kinseyi]|uniref:uncharacterized protein LOC117171088 n=1 Tax=Belonocnema kinseyi TaxID=2817044 RepID=UPI00143D31FD|nr:uncharacterized protein LOC117171088 [Belonocnema kinseyi]
MEKYFKNWLEALEKYLEAKKLVLNVARFKVLVFGRKSSRKVWKWRGEGIEEVKEFTYLGFLFKKNENVEDHVKERVKRADIVMKKIWGIGENLFKEDCPRRMRMFEALVRSVLMYGVEIWGWKEYEEVEKFHEKYIRWTLGLDRWTPWYIVLKEVNREKIKVRTGNMACKYEERLFESKGRTIVKACLKERENGKGDDYGMKEREMYLNRCGWSKE